jgi:hypothetical protein
MARNRQRAVILIGYCGDRERAQSKDRDMLTTRQG